MNVDPIHGADKDRGSQLRDLVSQRIEEFSDTDLQSDLYL